MKRQFQEFDDARVPRRFEMPSDSETTIADMPTDRSYWVDFTGRVQSDDEDFYEKSYDDTIVIDSGPDKNRRGRAFLNGDVLLDGRNKIPRVMGAIGVRAAFNYKISRADRSRFYVADLRFIADETIPTEDLDTRPVDEDEREYFGAWRDTFLPISAFAYLGRDAESPEDYTIVGDKNLHAAVHALCADSRERERRKNSDVSQRELDDLRKDVDLALSATASYISLHKKFADEYRGLERMNGDFAYDNDKFADAVPDLQEMLRSLRRKIRDADGEEN